MGAETGWLPKPLVARDGPRLVAACPLYVKSHSEGEFVFDWGWADAAERAGIRYYPKLLVGVPFTPVTGARFLVAPGEDRAGVDPAPRRRPARPVRRQRSLGRARQLLPRRRARAPAPGRATCCASASSTTGTTRASRSFDDYLARFRSKRRNQIRRERREMREQGVVIETARRRRHRRRSLRADVPLLPDDRRQPLLGPPVPESARSSSSCATASSIACASSSRARAGELIAGTANVEKSDVLYGRYWGATRPLRHLHFNVCYYAAIEHCIEAGSARFEPGAGGDYKFLRGFDAQPTYSLHYLREPRLADAVARFLEAERAEAQNAISHLRDQSVLKKNGASDI